MADVTMADIQKLRKLTGAGMMDCKKALVEAEGNFDKAVELIRERGKAIAAKRADREATEGVVLAAKNAEGNRVGMLSLSCETDFVAKNADFVALAQKVLDAAVKEGVKELDALKAMPLEGKTADTLVQEFSGVTGEKMELAYYAVVESPSVTFYIHPGNKLASIVGGSKAGADEAVLKDVAMQIAGMNPVAVDADSVPEEVKKKEFEIGREQARNEGKPEKMLDKIAEGRLNKFLKENTLMAQEFVKEGKITVEQYLAQKDKELKIQAFARFSLQD
ncbi:MAG: elongation factor Ts [Bacteroidia bacterium]|nr:MAG: elongation factor Ts [Bacteroidia bacterium]